MHVMLGLCYSNTAPAAQVSWYFSAGSEPHLEGTSLLLKEPPTFLIPSMQAVGLGLCNILTTLAILLGC